MKESQTSSLFGALGMVVLAMGPEGTFHPVGASPDWFTGFCPECSLEKKAFNSWQMSPFLEAFIDEAAGVWAEESGFPVVLKSGWWTKIEPNGAVHYFQATAVRLPRTRLLVIRHEPGDSELFAALQGYKESFLTLSSVKQDKETCAVELGKLKEMAVTDELTGLPNERGFFALASEMIEAAKKRRLANLVFTVSLSELARINAQYGHTEGSMALIAVSDILRKTFGGQSVVARLGGGEFAVLAVETAYLTENVYKKALEENLDAFNRSSFKTYRMELSSGAIRLAPEYAGTLKDALEKAVSAMRGGKMPPAKGR